MEFCLAIGHHCSSTHFDCHWWYNTLEKPTKILTTPLCTHMHVHTRTENNEKWGYKTRQIHKQWSIRIKIWEAKWSLKVSGQARRNCGRTLSQNSPWWWSYEWGTIFFSLAAIAHFDLIVVTVAAWLSHNMYVSWNESLPRDPRPGPWLTGYQECGFHLNIYSRNDRIQKLYTAQITVLTSENKTRLPLCNVGPVVQLGDLQKNVYSWFSRLII